MASITHDKKTGRRTIQFVGADRRRRSIRLGKVSKRHADAVKSHVEHLVSSSVTLGAVERRTLDWLAALDTELADKLAAVGLTAQRESSRLKEFVSAYIAGRVDAKPRTVKKWRTTERYLNEHFGAVNLRDVSPGDADGFRLMLIKKGGRENTVRKHIQIAKLFFTAAVRSRLIPESPFAGIKSGTVAVNDRYHFATHGDVNKLIKYAPSTDWQLVLALSRYGGLRVPSEIVPLRWSDINWADNRTTVTSPKTEHHPGGESRIIPIFAELRPYLDAAFAAADDGAEFVIPSMRDPDVNLRTQIYRIARKASVKMWPKPFQNMRSSRETELMEHFPAHVVVAWLGNSEAVARKHYLQVTEDHFASGAEALHYPVQQPSAGSGNVQNTAPDFTTRPLKDCNSRGMQLQKIAGTGLEPV